MLFRTIDHYHYRNDILICKTANIPLVTPVEIVDCFICYEIAIANEVQPSKLRAQQHYIKLCTCDGWIHKQCLDEWYAKTTTCPICRTYMSKNYALSVEIINRYRSFLYVYLFIKRYMYSLMKICATLVFIGNLYLSVMHKYIIQDDDDDIYFANDGC